MMDRLVEFARHAGWRGEIREVSASELDESDRTPQAFAHHLV